jgi:hypothetical protein
VDQSAEPFAATEPIEREDFARALFRVWWRRGERRSLAKRAVRSMLVVVQRVGGHDAFEVLAAPRSAAGRDIRDGGCQPNARRALVPAVPVWAP